MSASSSIAGRYYRPELDALRFLAFVLVFLMHSAPAPDDPRIAHVTGLFRLVLITPGLCGAYGVSLFFVLSAFLICELLQRERDKTNTVHVGGFYVRRALRIWPVYYLALALGAVWAMLPGNAADGLTGFAWYAFFLGNWRVALWGTLSNPVGPLWSISVEEQFYLVAPWAMCFLTKKTLALLSCVLIFISFGVALYLGNTQAGDSRIWCDALVQFQCFAAGILLSLGLSGRLPQFSFLQRIGLMIATFACWFPASYWLKARFLPGEHPAGLSIAAGYFIVTVGAALLFLSFHGINGKLVPRWATYMGRLSYGLYVYHEFSIRIVGHFFTHKAQLFGPAHMLKGVSAILLTLVLAMLSYHLFEKPFLKMKKKHSYIVSDPASGNDTTVAKTEAVEVAS